MSYRSKSYLRFFKVVVVSVFIILAYLAANAQSEKVSVYDEAMQKADEGDYGAAEALLKSQISLDKNDIVAYAVLGEVYRLKGDRKEAVSFLQKAISIDADYAPAHFMLGKVYILMQKNAEAREEFRIFKEKMTAGPLDGNKRAYYMTTLHEMVSIYFSLKEYDAAKEQLDEILRLDPSDQLALYNLGVYQYRHKRNRPEAFRAFTKAIEADDASSIARKAKYAIDFMRSNPDARVEPDFSFIDNE